jgi:hypothetical protein
MRAARPSHRHDEEHDLTIYSRFAPPFLARMHTYASNNVRG